MSLTQDPDGALILVDMYRAVIEHPEFMPTELKNRPDLTLGKERGRIWRIAPEANKPGGKAPDLGKLSAARTGQAPRPRELVAPVDRPAAAAHVEGPGGG